MWTIRQTINCIRLAWPHALKLVIVSLGWAVRLAALGFISLFRDLDIVDEIAERWLADALANGFPMLWERQLRFCFRTLAAFSIVAGWMIIGFTGYFTANYAYNLIFLQP